VHNTPALAAALAGLTKNRNSQIILHMQNEMSVDGLDGKVALAVPSRYLANWYSQRLPRCDVHIITNGVDTDIYRPVWSPPDPSLLRAQLNLATDKKIIMFAGRICREKGVLELIQAFHHLHKLRNDVNLLIIGEVRSQGRKGDRRAEYGRQVLELCQPLANSCHLLGNVDPAAIHNYYRLADLLVVPSLFEEPFGMVAIEAMAAGVPVLAARRGGLPEFIKHEINGFLTDDAARPDVLASQIHGLLGQPERLGMIRIAARQYVEQHHTWGHVAKQMETIYERMLTC
jgi:glycosyltransferase involved in cell wall biosynthesis